MSIDEDIQLRDLVAQTLESNGTLAKIKAQLRASIFLALDEDDKISSMKPSMNSKVTNYLETEEGIAMFCLVHEFLEFFELDFTLSVYQSETYCDSKYQYEGRQKLLEKLGLENIENISSTVPLLFHLVKMNQTKPRSIKINLKIGGDTEEKSTSENTESDDVVKTAVDSISTEIEDERIMDIKNTANERQFNTTFDLTSPTVNSLKTTLNSGKYSTKIDHQFHNESQNIFDGTFDKMNYNSDNEKKSSFVVKNFPPVSVGSANKISEAVINGFGEESLKDMPSNVSPISDKVKMKNSLSSLSDLPPIQFGKPRVNVILPSLYSKESKDKTNSLEHGELFDMSAEYEEDFMCSGDDLSLKSDCSKINLMDELLAANESMNSDKSTRLMKKDSEQRAPKTNISDCNKSTKPTGDSQASKDTRKNLVGLNNVNSETDISDNIV